MQKLILLTALTFSIGAIAVACGDEGKKEGKAAALAVLVSSKGPLCRDFCVVNLSSYEGTDSHLSTVLRSLLLRLHGF